MKTTNRRLRQMYAALSALSARTLPTLTSDLKVAALMRSIRGPIEDMDVAIRKARESSPVPDGVEGEHVPVAIVERRQEAIDQMLDAEIELPDIPASRLLVDADLPRALKSGAGEENRQGLADILVNLDVLYRTTDEEAE